MIPDIRAGYNDAFREETYNAFCRSFDDLFQKHIDFKICETPVFIPQYLTDMLLRAGEEIIDVICRPDFAARTESAIPDKWRVPGEEGKSVFLALDFGICNAGNGLPEPRLIELQGFSSLYAWQDTLARHYRKFFHIPDNLKHLFGGLDHDAYRRLLRKEILADKDPEQVILLEVEPDKQKTWIDFHLLREQLGIEPVCISKVRKDGRALYYEKKGRRIPILRIYNRLIFDEFAKRNDLQCQWHLTEEADVEWVCHPNWFFRISKFTLPLLGGRFVPETHYLSDLEKIPTDLENWVLKPLFSFAGSGVVFNVTQKDIDEAGDPAHFILQRKVEYAPVIQTPDVPAYCELRLMYLWEHPMSRPRLVTNLARLSKGHMIGVNFNKNKNWVGGTVGFFEMS